VVDAPPRPPEEAPERRHLELRPLSTDTVVRGGLGIVAVSLLAYALTGSDEIPLVAAMVVGLVGASYLATFVTPALLISVGLAMSMFSGQASHIGLPISPDRIFVAAGLGSLAFGLPGVERDRAITWRPLHAVLAVVAAIGTLSALSAGTLTTELGFFSLLDRLGLVPFIVFALAPLIYGKAKDRNTLLVVLVVTGAYLGVTALLEGTKNGAWAIPRYIDDPAVGSAYGRARGPFVEPGAFGMAMYGCAVAWAVSLLCLIGTAFTLTRAVWLATVVASVIALLTNSRTRRVLLPVAIGATVVLVAALAFVPGFADKVSERQSEQSPLWDRYNTNHAAIEMVKTHPLTGVGWNTFEEEAPSYMHISKDYPLTGIGIPVHNVPLSHAAELGLIGAALWLLGLAGAMFAAIFRPGIEELEPWRLGMVALFIHWAIVASFAPLGYAFPNLLLWTWAGIAALSHTSRRLAPDELV
jgi:O-antigen ligase